MRQFQPNEINGTQEARTGQKPNPPPEAGKQPF